MKYLRLWLNKKVPRSYQRSGLKGLDPNQAQKQTELFINESRKRIQDLELAVKEMAQKLESINE